jgi:outer membrane protein OmpA-like peptidoglycan-associated protein
MRLNTAALLASALFAFCGFASSAMAQTGMGNEVTVNPVTAGGGVLLYPGGQYMRVVPPLLEPGQSRRDAGPITLHMPGKRAAVTAAARPKRAPRVAEAAPATGGFDNLMPGMPATAPTPPPPAPRAEAKPAPVKPAPVKPAPARPAPATQLAKVEPPTPAATPAPETLFPGMTKRSMISFLPDQTDPAQSALGAIKYLATDLNGAMTKASSRIQLIAYGGTRGDKGSDARRLSLKRALAIRQVLIDDGVPAERIDVRAMGGVDDSGPTDRVDVYIKA